MKTTHNESLRQSQFAHRLSYLIFCGFAVWLLPGVGWSETITAVREWPADTSFNSNGVAPNSTALSLFLWWCLMTLPGWLAWPLLIRLLEPLGGAGFLMVRTLAWLFMGWIAWWAASIFSHGNTQGYVWAITTLVGLACLAAAWARRVQLAFFLRKHWRIVCCGEALFATALSGFALVRMHNPDLWHPTLGGEKLMEFAYLNGILRSAELPPADPHFAGEAINYYYFGFYLVAFWAKLGGFRPEVAFTLAVPALFALSALNAYSIALACFVRRFPHNFPRAAMLSLLAPLAVCIAGNPAGLVQLGTSILNDQGVYDFWAPSRVIKGTITEFPYWSFLFGDLHPHLISIPFFLAFLALLLGALRAHRQALSFSSLVLPTWVLGALACINPWDLPTAFGLLALVVFSATNGTHKTWTFMTRALVMVACLAIAWVAFAPFPWNYQATGVSGLGWVRSPDDLLQWLQVWALPLFVLGSGIWLAARGQPNAHRALLAGVAIALPPAWAGWYAASISLCLLVPAIYLFKRAPSTHTDERFLALMVVTGLLLLTGMQFIHVRDFLDGSPFYRMNTVFKFSIHAWVMLMLAVALVVPCVLAQAYSSRALGLPWALALGVLCIASFTFPVAGTSARIDARIDGAQDLPPTLNALAFMREADFELPGSPVKIRLNEDFAAVQWLNKHVQGHALILESSRVDYYRHFGTRIASLTGLSGLSGLHQPEQRDPARMATRATLHRSLWTTRESQQACRLYREHGIDIVYAGQLERIEHPQMIDQLPVLAERGCLVPVFKQGSTTIYFTRDFIRHRDSLGTVIKSPSPEITKK